MAHRLERQAPQVCDPPYLVQKQLLRQSRVHVGQRHDAEGAQGSKVGACGLWDVVQPEGRRAARSISLTIRQGRSAVYSPPNLELLQLWHEPQEGKVDLGGHVIANRANNGEAPQPRKG